MLFNIDLCELLVIIDQHHIASHADDSTPCGSGKKIDEAVKSWDEAHVIKWFNDDQFQENASKFHVLLRTDQQVHVNIDTAQIKNIQYEELLGVTIDTKLSVKT